MPLLKYLKRNQIIIWNGTWYFCVRIVFTLQENKIIHHTNNLKVEKQHWCNKSTYLLFLSGGFGDAFSTCGFRHSSGSTFETVVFSRQSLYKQGAKINGTYHSRTVHSPKVNKPYLNGNPTRADYENVSDINKERTRGVKMGVKKKDYCNEQRCQ